MDNEFSFMRIDCNAQIILSSLLEITRHHRVDNEFVSMGIDGNAQIILSSLLEITRHHGVDNEFAFCGDRWQCADNFKFIT